MLDANGLACMLIRPACDVAGREDPGRARLEIGIDDDTAINGKPAPFGECGPRAHADAGDNEIGIKRTTALKLNLLALNGACGFFEVKDHTVLLMERADKVTHLRTENALHRSFIRSHHMNFNFTSAQGRSDFESDKTRTHHNSPARSFGNFDNGPAVGERAQRADVRLISAWDRKTNRLCASREQ